MNKNISHPFCTEQHSRASRLHKMGISLLGLSISSSLLALWNRYEAEGLLASYGIETEGLLMLSCMVCTLGLFCLSSSWRRRRFLH